MTGDVPADVRPGPRHRGGRRRGRAGSVSARVLLALAASTVVTVAVSGPMAYQAHQARTSVATDEPATGRRTGGATTTTVPVRVLPSTTSREGPDEQAGPDQPPSSSTTTSTVPGGPPTTSAASSPTVPTTTAALTPPGGVTGPPTPADPPPAEPPSTTAPTTTTVPAPSPTDLVWTASGRVEPRDAEPLQGAVLSRERVWIYFRDRAASRVEFRLDDESATGAPFHIDLRWAFSLVPGPTDDTAGWFDTGPLVGGTHSVRADVTFADGTTALRLAYFTVED